MVCFTSLDGDAWETRSGDVEQTAGQQSGATGAVCVGTINLAVPVLSPVPWETDSEMDVSTSLCRSTGECS